MQVRAVGAAHFQQVRLDHHGTAGGRRLPRRLSQREVCVPHRAATLSSHVARPLPEPDVRLPVSDPGERAEDAVAGGRLGPFLRGSRRG